MNSRKTFTRKPAMSKECINLIYMPHDRTDTAHDRFERKKGMKGTKFLDPS